MNWMTAPQFIAHHWVRLPALVPRLLQRIFHLPLLAWTIRSPEEYAAAMNHADNVVFEGFVPRNL
jgi:glycerophosphoryl diester phosphodiesterase